MSHSIKARFLGGMRCRCGQVRRMRGVVWCGAWRTANNLTEYRDVLHFEPGCGHGTHSRHWRATTLGRAA